MSRYRLRNLTSSDPSPKHTVAIKQPSSPESSPFIPPPLCDSRGDLYFSNLAASTSPLTASHSSVLQNAPIFTHLLSLFSYQDDYGPCYNKGYDKNQKS